MAFGVRSSLLGEPFGKSAETAETDPVIIPIDEDPPAFSTPAAEVAERSAPRD